MVRHAGLLLTSNLNQNLGYGNWLSSTFNVKKVDLQLICEILLILPFLRRALFAKGEMTANTRAMSALTCLLQGPFESGQAMLGLKGVLEIMVAMTGSEDEVVQVTRIRKVVLMVVYANR